MEKTNTCVICNTAGSVNLLNPSFGGVPVCVKCGRCEICDYSLLPHEIAFCLKYSTPIRHSRCALGNANNTIAISLQELEQLNLARLCIIPDEDLGVETNKEVSIRRFEPLFNSLDLLQKGRMLAKLEALYSHAFKALRNDQKLIQSQLDKIEDERFNKAQKDAKEKYAQGTSSERKFAKLEARKEKKVLSKKQKFYEGMKATGVDDATIKAIWEKKWPNEPWDSEE